jgi:pimeloyl-ACP methyl ester carboxylesterase
VFAEDLAWRCGERGLHRPVMDGHSMGWVVVLEFATRFPNLPTPIIAVGAMLFPVEVRQAVEPRSRAFAGPPGGRS